MHTTQSNKNESKWFRLIMILGIGFLVILTIILAALAVLVFQQVRSTTSLGETLHQLLGIDSTQVWWYVTRSSALVAFFLLWLSTAWGIALSSKINDRFLARGYIYDVHQYISLLAIGFMLIHISVLMVDRYLPFSIIQIIFPFTSSYRPLWVGVGVIAFYLTILVTVTFYIRRRIGMRTFRVIHVLSLVAYLGATLHGFYAGTDTTLLSVQLLYKGSFLVTVFLLSYWLIRMLQNRSRQSVVNPGKNIETAYR